jgi:hypothetical protein
MQPRIIETLEWDTADFKKLSSQKIAVVGSCSVIEGLFTNMKKDNESESEAIKFYYQIEEKISSFYLSFPTSIYTFFHQRLQELSLRVLESGIKQHWNAINPYETFMAMKKRKYYENEEYLLTLNDIWPAFLLLAFGLILSSLVFLLEIFWHDFLQRFDMKKIFRNIRRFCFRMAWRPRNNVRFIQVQPAVAESVV